MVMSSLAFISVFDAVTVVAWYALSAVVARGVVYFECAGMQAVGSESQAAKGNGVRGQAGMKGNGHVVKGQVGINGHAGP